MPRVQDLNGFFPNFPTTTHASAVLSTGCPRARLQDALITVLHRLNSQAEPLPNLTDEPQCETRFEVGVAHAITFHYLDREEATNLRKRIVVKAFPTLDLLIICCYYVHEKGKRKPLKFDRHLLRFMFQEGMLDIRVYHERGPRRTPLEELLKLIVERINTELGRNGLPPIHVRSLKAL